jgi:hypothetical protein
VKILSEDSSLILLDSFVCNIYSDVCCVRCSVLKNVEIRFPFTHIVVNSVPSYVQILLASRTSVYKEEVCIDVILVIIFINSV